ncbi:MAG: recombination protein RecR [Planctomycetia bacterium]|nr:MAG: recombination protein RecR [Planctomycetia bacterium]
MSEPRLSGPLQRLIDELRKLPGVGARSAERIAFHLLKQPTEEAVGLARTIIDIKERVRPCSRCFNLAEDELCDICRDPRRDAGLIVVVEQPKDLLAFEAGGLNSGVYHVLMGRVSALDGVEPRHLTIESLRKRISDGGVREVVLATNPTLEGDATALCLIGALADSGVTVTRLARGLPPGGQIEHANRSMLEAAFQGRQ